ncbi:DUF397 domain-containing protein [Nonomuraea sp. NPDC049158]|uniref:DUF397 domain-containing protein n=1 Tax=Nonomuraea sp. NPDC049158 TaxID=3155649 RepID=UPI0033E64CF9
MTSKVSAPHWVKSTYSNFNGNCVEVADFADGRIGVRDSKDPSSPVLVFSTDEWNTMLDAIKSSSPEGLLPSSMAG